MMRPLLSIACASMLLSGGCSGDDEPSNPTAGTGAGTMGDCDSPRDCGTSTSGTAPDTTTTTLPDSTAGSTDEAGDSTTGSPDECAASADCTPAFCVAPFNPDLGVFGRGAFACVTQCVPLDDDFQWCADVEACCDPEATCTDRGYCKLPGGDSTGGTDTGADGDSSGGSTGQ